MYKLAFSLTSVFICSQLVSELLSEGQALSMGVSRQSGRGGQWLALISQLITAGAVSDVSLVPVGIAYDCVPKANFQVCVLHTHTQLL